MGHRPDWNNQNFKKGSVRGFADGGDVDTREAAREPTVDTYEYGRYEEQEDNRNRYLRDMAAQASKELEETRIAQEDSREAMPKGEAKPESFKEAFARNRAAGAKTFEWNGKLYGTELAKPSKADYNLGKLNVSAKRDEPAPAKPTTKPTTKPSDKKILDYGDDKERMAKRKPMTVVDRKMRSMQTGLPEAFFMADGGKVKKK